MRRRVRHPVVRRLGAGRYLVAATLATMEVKVDLSVSNSVSAPKPQAPVTLSLQAEA